MIESYRPFNDVEAKHLDDITSLMAAHAPRCYDRDHFEPGHITGSAFLVSADNKRVLMNHHRALDKWLCFGGHADGERDILSVAWREIVEESGIENIEPVTENVFDVDVHLIPANSKRQEPAHHHFDIRYLFRVQSAAAEQFVLSHESRELRWCLPDEARDLTLKGGGMARMLDKWTDAR